MLVKVVYVRGLNSQLCHYDEVLPSLKGVVELHEVRGAAGHPAQSLHLPPYLGLLPRAKADVLGHHLEPSLSMYALVDYPKSPSVLCSCVFVDVISSAILLRPSLSLIHSLFLSLSQTLFLSSSLTFSNLSHLQTLSLSPPSPSPSPPSLPPYLPPFPPPLCSPPQFLRHHVIFTVDRASSDELQWRAGDATASGTHQVNATPLLPRQVVKHPSIREISGCSQ